MAASGGGSDFVRNKHIKFFKRCLHVLPGRYASLDTNRVTIVFFAISGLDLLNALDEIRNQHHAIIEWIYSMQIVPDNEGSNLDRCGFRGSTTACTDSYDDRASSAARVNSYESGHIAMTYTALCILLILGDDLSRVNRKGILAGLSKLQLADGSFCTTPEGSENDMRFVYCACCISYILDDWSAVDLTSMMSYVSNSMSFCGAFGQGPFQEAHGGSTFCAVAALILSGQSSAALSANQRKRLIRWCLNRQQSGFQGRPNKPVDTCYSFWVGATLQLLDTYHLTDKQCNRSFLMQTQSPIAGGFSKWPDCTPDALHAYFGVCGLSLLAEPGIKSMHAALNISQSASARLDQLHTRWRSDCVRARSLAETFSRRLVESVRNEHDEDDIDRLSAVYCCLLGLDVQDSLHLLAHSDQQDAIDWIYSLQTQTDEGCTCGFHASTKCKKSSEQVKSSGNNGLTLDLKVTNYALRCLLLLRDDLSRVDSAAVIRTLQQIGAVRHNRTVGRADLVEIYLCVSISFMLQDCSAIDQHKVVSGVRHLLLIEGNLEKLSELEAFCAIATLSLLDIAPNMLFTQSGSAQLKMLSDLWRTKCDAIEMERGFTSLSPSLLINSINKMLDHCDSDSNHDASSIENSTHSLSLNQQECNRLSFLKYFDQMYVRALQEIDGCQKICLPLLVSHSCLQGKVLPNPCKNPAISQSR